MSNLRKIEKLTGGKATLTQQPANDFFPATHWFLQTADGGRFGATSKRDLLASIAEFLTDYNEQGELCLAGEVYTKDDYNKMIAESPTPRVHDAGDSGENN